jgi:membrane protease YdiL (CAAX protease family)
MTRVLSLIRAHSVVAYFLLTFVISWGGVWLLIGLSGDMAGSAAADDPRFFYALIAMLAGPSVASLLVTAIVAGQPGLRELASRTLVPRVAVRWYAVAVLVAPLVWISTLGGLSLVSDAFLPGILTANDRVGRVLVGLAVALSVGGLEELGWTGFAIPRLRRRRSALATGVIVGVLWGAWHLLTNVVWPARASAGDLPVSVFLPLSALAVLFGYLVAFRVLMVWVYDRTGSLLTAMVMHASLTASVLILDPVGLSGVALLTYSCALGAVLWGVVGIVAAWQRDGMFERSVERRRRAAWMKGVAVVILAFAAIQLVPYGFAGNPGAGQAGVLRLSQQRNGVARLLEGRTRLVAHSARCRRGARRVEFFRVAAPAERGARGGRKGSRGRDAAADLSTHARARPADRG